MQDGIDALKQLRSPRHPGEDILKRTLQQCQALSKEHKYRQAIPICLEVFESFSQEDRINNPLFSELWKTFGFIKLMDNDIYQSLTSFQNAIINCPDEETYLLFRIFNISSFSNLLIHQDEDLIIDLEGSLQKQLSNLIPVYSQTLSVVKNATTLSSVAQQILNIFSTLEEFNMIQTTILNLLVFEMLEAPDSEEKLELLISLLNQLLKIDPKNPKYLTGRIQFFAQFGKYEQFVDSLQKTQQNDLGQYKYHVFLGIKVLFHRRKQHFSLNYFEQIQKYHPSLFEKNNPALIGKDLGKVFPMFQENIIEIMKASAFSRYMAPYAHFHPVFIFNDLLID